MEQIGFITDDKELYGCSPDGLIGTDGMVEIKCRKAEIQVNTIIKSVPHSENIAQIQGQMWIAGRVWCDYVSYHPDLPLFVYRVKADPVLHKALELGINEVIAIRDEILIILWKK